jgi:flagellar M-ring protein FliF
MGYNQARGDTLNVANAPFDGVDKPAGSAGLVEGSEQPAAGEGRREVPVHRPVLLFLWYRILRPMLRR